MKYFEQAFDGQIIIINSRNVKSDKQLVDAYDKFINSPRVIIIGHTHQPSLANRKLVSDFWQNIYRCSDMKFTILRNPVDRSISWIKAAGNLSRGDNPDHGIPFRFRGLNQNDSEIASLIELQRGSRSSFDDNIYDCIMPDNFLADSPDNLNIAGSVANYPVELMSSDSYLRWLTPLSIRTEEQINEYKSLFEHGLNISKLISYLAIPHYDFFAIENIHKLVRCFEERSITKPGFSVPHINSTAASLDISIRIRRMLTNLYPESYLLWKHALGMY